MAEEFRSLLNRTDIPKIIVEYDTTFDLGTFYVSWVTFRHTEFNDLPRNPMPTMGLACLIHNKKLQSSHEYFWNMIKEEIPSIATATNLVICTDDEAAIVNAIETVSKKKP
jgi:hypothetical protein